MQLLFSQNRDQALADTKVIELYEQALKKSFELYLFNLFILTRIAAYSKEDAKKRHSKYLPKPEDLLFSPKIYENECIQGLVNSKALNGLFKLYKFEEKYDEDLSRKVYIEFAKNEAYDDYVYDEAGIDEHRKILLTLFKTFIKNELIVECLDDFYSNWQDDKSLIIGVMKKTIKALPPQDDDFFSEHKPEDDTTKDFGLKLLHNVLEHEDIYKKQIEEIVQNWDVERVAVIDIILLKMAATEFKIFPSIPSKVTINEYMEISKMYSTEKSKDFINGILDKLYHNLKESGDINKVDEEAES